LDFDSTHLARFGVLLDVGYEFLFLVLKLGALAIEFALGLFEGALVFAEAFGGGHAFAEGPFDDLLNVSRIQAWKMLRYSLHS